MNVLVAITISNLLYMCGTCIESRRKNNDGVHCEISSRGRETGWRVMLISTDLCQTDTSHFN